MEETATDHQIADLNRQLAIANLRLEYSTLVAETRVLDSQESYRKLAIKYAILQDSKDAALSAALSTRSVLTVGAAELRTRVAQAEGIAADLREEIDRSKAETEWVMKELQGKEKMVQEGMESIREKEERIKELENLKRDVEGKLGAVEENSRMAEERSRAADRKLEAAERTLETTERKLEAAEKRLQVVEGAREGGAEEIVGLRRECGRLKREVELLKTELASLNVVSEKSNRLLSENIALTHQVSSLNTELTTLRTINETSQTHLAEKLELQRRAATLEFELDNERKVVARLKEASEVASNEEKRLRRELADLKQTVYKETKAREKAEQNLEKTREEWESREKVLKGKVEAGRKAIRELKEIGAGGKKRNMSAAYLTMEDLEAVKKPRVKGPSVTHSEFSMTPFFKKQVQHPQLQGQGRKEKREKGAPGDETVLQESSDSGEEDERDEMEEGGEEERLEEIANEREIDAEPSEGKGKVKKRRSKPDEEEADKTDEDGEGLDKVKGKDGSNGAEDSIEAVAVKKTTGAAGKIKKKKRNKDKDKETEKEKGSEPELLPVMIPQLEPPKLLLAGAGIKKKKKVASSVAVDAAGKKGGTGGRGGIPPSWMKPSRINLRMSSGVSSLFLRLLRPLTQLTRKARARSLWTSSSRTSRKTRTS
ncbi:hypothetical protein BDZ91DRAFT_78131 [Kalaharituber pfeilii]|nr:hypothetical protein BDZ91DRAFT_78131 [Kalaharituber pfeilii]